MKLKISCLSVLVVFLSFTSYSQLSVSASGVDVSCNGGCDGEATATVSGGTAPYSYMWSNGDVVQTVSGLCAGLYYVTVTDNNADQTSDSIAINEPAAITITTSVTEVSSSNTCDGSASAATFGGQSPYSYSWSNGGTTSLITDLCYGSYTLTVTDANACIATASVFVDSIPALSVSISQTDASCGACDGDATANVSGGSTPYSYMWSNATTTTSILNLCPGSYSVTVTDNLTNTSSANVVINELSNITLTISETAATSNSACDGSASAGVSGGVSPYSYTWSNGGNTSSISNLCTGSYGITVADANGCSETGVANIDTLPSFSVSMSKTDASCGSCNGAANANVSGGASPYSYSWSNGEFTQSITSICSGAYSVTVTDNNGTTVSGSVSVAELSVNVTITVSATDESAIGACDGSASASTSGGSTPYVYIWSTGATTTSISNLCSGSYGVTVTESNGCIAMESVIVGSPDSLSVSISSTDEICLDGCEGTATVSVSGGSSPYAYQWSNGATSASITELCAGSYTVTVTDNNLNRNTRSVTIAQGSGDCVWPGDANSDGVADNQDILAISVGSGSTGPARTNPTINWEPQMANDWGQTLSGGANYKHVDCNGDGVIDGADTNAVVQNYGLTHNKAAGINTATASDPLLYLDIPEDSVGPGQEIEISVKLGDGTISATDIYAIAFAIEFDPQYVKAGSEHFSYNNSWLGDYGTDLIGIAHVAHPDGRIEVGMGRMDQQNVSGQGQIGTLRFTTSDNLPEGEQLVFATSTITAISSDETIKQVNAGVDSASTISSVESVEKESINVEVYPNPFNRSAVFEIGGSIEPGQVTIKVFNLLGKEVGVAEKSGDSLYRLERNELSSGVYFYKVIDGNEIIKTGKLIAY